MVEDTGFEPVTFGLQDRRSTKNELIPHIPQNTLCVSYLFSASTLLSWSTEPLHVSIGLPNRFTPRLITLLSRASIINKLHILLYTEFFSYLKRVASSRSKADNQKTVKLIHYNQFTINSITTEGNTFQQEFHLILYTHFISVERAYLLLFHRKSTHPKSSYLG